MVEAKLILGTLGDATCTIMFLSPLLTFWKIFKNTSTEHFSGFPYIMMLFSCLLWVFYGTRKVTDGDKLITIINGVGVVLGTLYVTLYAIYAEGKKKKKFIGFVGAIFLIFVLIVVIVICAIQYRKRKLVVGVVCVLANFLRYFAPLSIMKRVIRTKSVAFMPFWLSFSMCLNTSIWMSFGIVSKDIFIFVSNGVGTSFGIAQLALHAMYGCKRACPGTELEVKLPQNVSQPPREVVVTVVSREEDKGVTRETKLEVKLPQNVSQPPQEVVVMVVSREEDRGVMKPTQDAKSMTIPEVINV